MDGRDDPRFSAADAVVSVLARRPFSRWVAAGVAGVVVVAVLDAAVVSGFAFAGAMAIVLLLVALAGRRGDTAVVVGLGVALAAARGLWDDWDAGWAYVLGAVVAMSGIAGLVALSRSFAIITSRRLGLLQALLDLVDVPPEPQANVERVLELLVPTFADGCTLELEEEGERRLVGAAGAEPADATPARAMTRPLRTRGAPFGTLALALGPSGRRYSAADHRFGALVAGRVAVVLDNAGLTQQAERAEARLVAALDFLGEAVTMNGPDGRTVYANRAAVALLKAGSAEEVTGGPVGDVAARFAIYDEDGVPVSVPEMPAFRALAGEDDPEPMLVRNVVRATGEERWLRNKVTVLRDRDGAVDRVVNVIEDVSEVKRAELAQRLLAEATRVLSSSLDYERTLQLVAEVAVPALADWCAADLPDHGPAIELVALAHTDPARVAIGRELRRRYPVSRGSDTGLARVIEEGVTVHRSELGDADVVAHAQDEDHLGLLREIGFGSLLIVPLVAGGAPLGALTLVRSDPVRRFTDADRELAEELGQRAGIAVLNARLHTERATIARELQRGLLPPQLPAIPGLEVATLYRPAGELNEVGGDFYDAFPTPRGWMLVIGDVAGQGARAAALTGLARFTLRSVGQLTGDPRRAAQQLNRTLRDQPELSLCTAVCMLLQGARDGLEATIVSCGHPLPALHRGGTVTSLGVPGPLAGAYDDADWPASTAVLAADDALVLYTDGVFDTVGRSGRFGEERLATLLAAAPHGAAELVEHVDAALRAFQAGPQSDDTALVVVSVTDPGAVIVS
jgi:GAF domain-containing protein